MKTYPALWRKIVQAGTVVVLLVTSLFGSLEPPVRSAEAHAGVGEESLPLIVQRPPGVTVEGVRPCLAHRPRPEVEQPLVPESALALDQHTRTEEPGIAYNGDTITYTIVLTNQGSVPLDGVEVVDNLPNKLDTIACLAGYSCELFYETIEFPEPSGGMMAVTSTSGIRWSLGTLQASQVVSMSFSARIIGVSEGAVFVNNVHAGSASGETATDLHSVVGHIRVEGNGGATISRVPTWYSNDPGGTISQDWGDFDRDGDLDLVLGSSLGTTVYRNDAGRLTRLWVSDYEETRLSYGVRWIDVDQDPQSLELLVVGNIDADSAIGEGVNYIYRYVGGEETFAESGFFTSTYQLVRVEPGDYDGDGDLDIIASSNAIHASCPVLLYRNDGSGDFSGFGQCISKQATAALAAADYDDDGDLDLVLGAFPSTLMLLSNVRDGAIITQTSPFSEEIFTVVESDLEYLPYDLAWGDYNQDGYLDLAAAFPLQQEVRIYENQAGSNLVPLSQRVRTTSFMTPMAVDWADFDGDGRLELAAADSPPRIYHYQVVSNTVRFGRIDSIELASGYEQAWSIRGIDLSGRNDLNLVVTNRNGPSRYFTTFAPKLKPVPTFLTPPGSSHPNWRSNSVAWGDIDHDDDLDLLLGSAPSPSWDSLLYLNDDGVFDTRVFLESSGFGPHVVALADGSGVGETGERWLDAAVGIPTGVQIYYNGNTEVYDLWIPTASAVRSLAWGDADDVNWDAPGGRERRLDLLVGLSNGSIHLYINHATQLTTTPAFVTSAGGPVRSLAWGDWDKDYYLDFAVGTDGGPTRIYRNNGDTSFSLMWSSPFTYSTRSVAWADYDRDGDLDLAVGNYDGVDLIYENQEDVEEPGQRTFVEVWSSGGISATTALAWGDWDNDGDPDLAAGHDGELTVVYGNLGSSPGDPQLVPFWYSSQPHVTVGLAWGDQDGDGDLDLSTVGREEGGNGAEWNGFYENTLFTPVHVPGEEESAHALPNNPSYLYVERPGATPDAYHYSSPELVALWGVPTVTVRYHVYDPESDPIAATHFEYSLDGGVHWHTATPAPGGTPVTQTSVSGVEGAFVWDAAADDAVSENARFRVRVVHLNTVGPIQRATSSAISPPFRVRALDCLWPTGFTITADPEHPDPGEPVQFRAHRGEGPGSLIVHWDFGDGGTAEGWEPVHTFSRHGVYSVTLRADGPPCPITRPGYARKELVVGAGNLEYDLYLPLSLRSYAAGQTGGEEGARVPLPGAPQGQQPAAQPVPPLLSPDPDPAPVQPDTFSPAPSTYAPPAPPAAVAHPTGAAPDSPANDVRRIVHYSLGIDSQPTVNQDGSRVAFWSTGNHTGNNDDGNIEIFLAEVQTNDQLTYTQVTSSSGSILGGFNFHPSLSDAGDRIVFFSDQDLVSVNGEGLNRDRNFEIFLAEVPLGSHEVDITQVTRTNRGNNILPSISGDGTRIVFASDRDLGQRGNSSRNQEIFLAQIGATGEISFTQITSSTNSINDQPDVSAGGRFVTYISNQDGNPEIFRVEVLSSSLNSLPITNYASAISEQPAISGDGSRIAFISDFGPQGRNPDGIRQVFLAEIGAGEAITITQITFGGGDKDHPTINSDGTRIAYISTEDRRLHLYDTEAARDIAESETYQSAYPAFAADGMHLAFTSNWDVFLATYGIVDLQLEKSGLPAPASAGDALTYFLTVTNPSTNTFPASGILLEDVPPAEMEIILPDQPPDYTDDEAGEFIAGYGTTWNVANGWLELGTNTNWLEIRDSAVSGGSGGLVMDDLALLLHLNGNRVDSSTYDHPIECTGNCPSFVNGKLQQAVDFPGSQGLSGPTVLQPLTGDTFTFGAWVRPTGSGAQQTIMAIETSGGDTNISLLSYDASLQRFRHYGTGGTSSSMRRFQPDQWYHVVLVIGSGGNGSLYVNGNWETSFSTLCKPNPNCGTSFSIGNERITDIPTNYFHGRMDEVFVFNQGLTADEMVNIYRRQSPAHAGYYDSRVMETEEGVMGWNSLSWLSNWPAGRELPDYGEGEDYPARGVDMTGNVFLAHLNESTTPLFLDTSGAGNDGYCDGANCPTTGVSGQFDQAVHFEGSQVILVQSVRHFPVDEITLMYWIRSEPDEFNDDYDTPLSYIAGNLEFTMFYNDSNYEFYICNGGASRTAPPLSDGRWHHVALTWRSFDGRLQLYQDGLKKVETYVAPGCLLRNGGALHLGQDWFSPSGTFEGDLDEVAIFNRVLDTDEIGNHYRRGIASLDFQARHCDDAYCSGERFRGPDGTQTTYYSAPDDLALYSPQNDAPYVQYRAYLDTDETQDNSYSPQVRSVTIEPWVSCTHVPTVTCSIGTNAAPLAPDNYVSFDLHSSVTISACLAAEIGESGWPVAVNRADISAHQSDPHPDNEVVYETPLRVGIGDWVWEDEDSDGLQDENESGLAGVEVRLYESGVNNPTATTTTDSEGFYAFFQVPSGDYRLQFIEPQGYQISKQDVGSDDHIDSDPCLEDGRTGIFSVELGLDHFHWDAGMYTAPSVGDRVWHDANANGIQDAGEPGVEDVTVILYKHPYGQNDVVGTTQTNAAGDYLFENLQADWYKVRFQPPAGDGYVFSPANQGGNDDVDSDVIDEDGWTEAFRLQSGDQDHTRDAGIYIPPSVGDRVWIDSDADGIQDADETTGAESITVDLYCEGTLTATTTTDSSGYYSFTHLQLGVPYSLAFHLPSGYAFSPQDQGGDDTADSDVYTATGRTDPFTLSSGVFADHWDAGLYELPSVGDWVWQDMDGDGIQGGNEGAGLSQVTVRLFREGVDTGQSVTTGQSGNYVFTELEIGVPYSLAFQLPSSYVFSPQDQGGDDTKDSDVYTTTGRTDPFILGPGEHNTSWDAGAYVPTHVGSRVWPDENAFSRLALASSCSGNVGVIPLSPLGSLPGSLPATGERQPDRHYGLERHEP